LSCALNFRDGREAAAQRLLFGESKAYVIILN